MASVEKWKVVWCICFVLFRALKTESLETEGFGPAPEFVRHVVVKPRIFQGREKRSIQSTRKQQDGLEHIHDVTLTYSLHGKDHLIDLRLNRELIPHSYFERHHKNGSTVVRRPDAKNMELCHYIGKVRGIKTSWAAVSTCNGLRGMVYTGESLHYIEKAGDSNDSDSDLEDNIDGKDHYVYDHEDLNVNHTCGYSGTAHHINPDLDGNKLRYKRSSEGIRGPYNANRASRYVELVLVVDHSDFNHLGIKKVYTHCKDIANIINALYMPLNIFIALVGVVVWNERNEITISENGDTTLTNFLHYRRGHLFKEHPNDNAQLLTRVQFEGGVVGKALKGPICTFEFSGGVSMDHSPVVGLVATTVAHEMGHNFGMEHDISTCECPDERCIMAPSSSSLSPTHWSSCSLHYLASAFEHGMDYCLRNKPTRLYDSPVCGNGFVEAGEQCDCGLKEYCDNPCCNASTCMLYSNASCATGECCDFKTCRPKSAGNVCRSADHECDLPEYCSGQGEYCPPDVYKMDGESCDRGKAFCYQGSCRSHSDQCKLLWGPSGKSSDVQCYKMNTKGSRYGNCGYNRVTQSYVKCEGDNVHCGMLHCIHLNERLEFGMESVAILSHSFISSADNTVIPCRTAIVDLGLNEVDPGLAPDGAKCGPDMMCVNQKCMNVSSLRAGSAAGDCPMGCSGNGICNSLGHCHCKPGFAPPHCEYPGTGGSFDSGPATDPLARREVITALYLVFLGIVPFLAVAALVTYYIRRNPTLFWRKKPRSIIIIEKKTSSGLHPRGMSNDKRQSPGSGQLVNDHSRASLLPSTDCSRSSSIAGGSDDNPAVNNLQSNLLGQFKGFSITPLPSKQTVSPTNSVCVPIRPAPQVKSPLASGAQPVSPPKLPSNVAVVAPVRTAPKVPAANIGLVMNSQSSLPPMLPPANPVSSRPAISSPVLDTTTSCTAQELLSNLPLRKAPDVPDNSETTRVPVVCEVNPQDTKASKPVKESYPALTRLASFMARSQKEGKKDNPAGGSLRINKLDRDALRTLEISNPILQKEIAVPGEVLPAGGQKVVVMRAQSLRDSDKKPQIHSFGSMRAPSMKRPTSIPASARPTSPPPPRPPSIGLPGYQSPGNIEHEYDDCLNMISEGSAPLVNIDEESLNSPTDNIYAVIEESPVDRSERKEIILPKKLSSPEYTSPSGEYKVPKPLDNSVSTGSSESMGLLGEIVSEIQARNTDSIYSTSTLKRKKEMDDETSSTITDISETKSNQIYVNTPWQVGFNNSSSTPPKSCASSSSSSSGYLSPINSSRVNDKRTSLLSGSNELKKHSIENSTPTVSVPDVSAPSYKPYSSSLHRSNGPLAAYYNKSSLDTKPKTNPSQDSMTVKSSPEDGTTPGKVLSQPLAGMSQNTRLGEEGKTLANSKTLTTSGKSLVSPPLSNGLNEKTPVGNKALPWMHSASTKGRAATNAGSLQPQEQEVNSAANNSVEKQTNQNLPPVENTNSNSSSVKSPTDKKSITDSSKDTKKETELVTNKPAQMKVKSPDNPEIKKNLSVKNVPKTSSFRTGRTPLPAPKPVVIPNIKSMPSSSLSNTTKSNSTVSNIRQPNRVGGIQPKPVPPPVTNRPSVTTNASSSIPNDSNKQETKKGMPKPHKINNVASLQQKFEPGANRTPAVSNVTNKPNSTPATVKQSEINSTR